MLSLSNNSLLDMYFFININIFRHLKSGIALAIPGLNEWKIEANNSAGQGINWYSMS